MGLTKTTRFMMSLSVLVQINLGGDLKGSRLMIYVNRAMNLARTGDEFSTSLSDSFPTMAAKK